MVDHRQAHADKTRRQRELDRAIADLAATRSRQERVDKELQSITAATDPRSPTRERAQQLAQEREALARRVGELSRLVTDRRHAIDDALRGDIHTRDFDADAAAKRLDPRVPLLLMPLRLETRWFPTELRVRVYPDDWAVTSFDSRLTDTEVRNIAVFWASWFRAAGDDGLRREAWRGLVTSHGTERATWLVSRLRPSNPTDEPTSAGPSDLVLVAVIPDAINDAAKAAVVAYWRAWWSSGGDADGTRFTSLASSIGSDAAAAVRERSLVGLPTTIDPALTPTVICCVVESPALEVTKTASVFSGATANLLPDRVVVIGYEAGREVLRSAGRPIPPSLALGPDPDAPTAEQFAIVDDDLVVPEPLRWMVDFDEAERVGMGVRIPRHGPAQGGLDRLVVVGLRAGATATEDEQALASLFRAHEAGSGFAVVAQGTPTNNTDDTPSGYTRRDDSDAAFDRVFGTVAPADPADWGAKTDGRWLAECLGLDPGFFDRVDGGQGTDQAEAYLANVALWPATWGYFLSSMMHPLLDDDAVDAVRQFFLDNVSGRGRVPAVRIGHQPYGIVPTTAFARLRLVMPRQPPRPVPRSPSPSPPIVTRVSGQADPADTMAAHVQAMTDVMAEDWAALGARIAAIGPSANADQTLLDVVGLHPASVEFHQRYAESTDDLAMRLHFDGLANAFMSAWSTHGAVITGRQLLARLGYRGTDTPDVLSKVFRGSVNTLNGPVVDDRPLSEDLAVRAYCTDGRNYLRWLADSASASLDELRRERGFIDDTRPTALLYVLVRHALLLAWRDAAIRLRTSTGELDAAGRRALAKEPTFVHVSTAAAVDLRSSAWSTLYTPAPALAGAARRPLHEVIGTLTDRRDVEQLDAAVDAVARLSSLPTARLERLLAEHLDTCSHRLDAWRLGLVHHRLRALRNVASAASTSTTSTSTGRAPRRGIHVGAYGVLEAVQPDAPPTRPVAPAELDADLTEVFARRNDGPLVRDRTNGGYIHAPSLDHATTAAILRSGHMANSTTAHPDSFAVNLSSRRMRIASDLLEGLRNGQSLGTLLGYRFERALHDAHNLAEVDKFIHPLRAAFPESSDPQARLALDGLSLARHAALGGAKRRYPFDLPSLPLASTAESRAIDAQVDSLLDANDALADLVLSEGVHQGVLGNFDRVSAVLDAGAAAAFPPEPAVIQTPVVGTTMTHRVTVHLRAGLDPNRSPIAGLAMTPRASAAPAVNEWIASLAPDPSDVVVVVRWVGRDGLPHRRELSQLALGLQPIDLVDLLVLHDVSALDALDDLIASTVIDRDGLGPDTELAIAHTEAVDGKWTFFEVAPLVDHLRALARSRALRPSDLQLTASAGALAAEDRSRPVVDRAGADLVREQLARFLGVVVGARDRLTSLLADTIANRPAILAGIDAHLQGSADALRDAWRYGITTAGSEAGRRRRRDVLAVLRRIAATRSSAWRTRIARADTTLAAEAALPVNATAEERVALLLLAERTLTDSPTSPVPTDPVAFRAAVIDARDTVARAAADLEATTSADTLGTALRDTTAALVAAATFDSSGSDLSAIENQAIGLCEDARDALDACASATEARLAPADKALTRVGTAIAGGDSAAAVTAVGEAVRALLGEQAIHVPEFMLPAEAAAGLDAALAWYRTDGLTGHLTDGDHPVDDWLHGCARVRERLRSWEQVRLLAVAAGRPEPELFAAQLPHANEPWLAVEWPSTLAPIGEHVLVCASFAEAFSAAASQAGLVLDEWTEFVPAPSLTTGLTFNYDSPDSEPPQSMLLVVTPDDTLGWNFADITDAIADTMDLARLRGVEPDQVAATAYGAFLPATIMAATVRGMTISANLALNNDLMTTLRVDDA